VSFPQPDPVVLLRWSDGSPWRWLAVLAAASPWLRVAAGPVTLYPLHLLLTVLLGWALLRTEGGRLAEDVPLLPGAVLAIWLATVALFRLQGWAVGGALLGGASLWLWGWAASAVGRQTPPPRYFAEAALLFLVTTLLVGGAAWAAQWWAPEACAVFNCDPHAGLPYPFHGGWHSNAQYAVLLILLLPLAAEPLVRSLRDPRAGRARWAMIALTAVAGLALLAGARAGLLLVVAAGMAGFAWTLAPDRHPADRLMLRGMVFFTLFGAVALYGLAPGYLGPLLGGRGDSRSAGIVVAPGGGVVLSSDRSTRVPIRLVNTGWSDLRADDERPLRIGALLLFTPRTGLTRAYPAGDLLVYQTLAPGEGLDVSLPVRLPHWVNTGFMMWQLRDAAGTPIPVTEGNRGFRFANASYYALDQAGDNPLTALATRARAFVARALPPPTDLGLGLSFDSLLGNAVDTVFFSPLWGHRAAEDPGAGPLNPVQSVWLQLLHSYGLIGLGLGLWFALRLLRQSWQVALARQRSGARLAWRLVPVSVVLLGGLAALSGEVARYHSLWGCFLLSGFVEGAHARQYPSVWRLKAGLRVDPRRFDPRRWLSRLPGAPRGWPPRWSPPRLRWPRIGLPGPPRWWPRWGRKWRSPLYLDRPARRWPRWRLPRLRLPPWRRGPGHHPPRRLR
jgi:hypothetical protein